MGVRVHSLLSPCLLRFSPSIFGDIITPLTVSLTLLHTQELHSVKHIEDGLYICELILKMALGPFIVYTFSVISLVLSIQGLYPYILVSTFHYSVHIHHETTQCFIKQSRDFCVLANERQEVGDYIITGHVTCHVMCHVMLGKQVTPGGIVCRHTRMPC